MMLFVGVITAVTCARTGAVVSIVIMLLVPVESTFGLPARSKTFQLDILAAMFQLFVTLVVISNAVPLFGEV